MCLVRWPGQVDRDLLLVGIQHAYGLVAHIRAVGGVGPIAVGDDFSHSGFLLIQYYTLMDRVEMVS